jgi:glycosyltransferase involved in cell wall biosynthesis
MTITIMNSLKNKKIALVYDRVNKWGGAERVLLALHEIFPNAPLFTSVYNTEKTPWANAFNPPTGAGLKTSFLQKIPLASSRHESLPFLMPAAFESFSFEGYDLVISVTSEAAKGIIVKPPTKHICYCLTPTRYLWSGYNEYFSNRILRFIAAPAVSYLKKWDLVAAQRPDAYIAISEEVKKRIKTYYKKDAVVVYPPLGMSNIKYQMPNVKWEGQEDYYLVVSRLVAYKRVDLAIEACNELGLSLKIVGSGSEEAKLREIAGPTIEFVGNLTDEQLITYYKHSKGLLFPGYEDFGLVIVEAQSFGKPVLAYKAGGALETIIDGNPSTGSGRATGMFFTPQTKESLKEALEKFDKKKFKEKDCIEQAKKFGKVEFKKRFIEALEVLIN